MLSAEQISRAEAVSNGDVASARGFIFDRAGNHAGPCPHCGGKDRFSISIRKGVFLCRQCHPKGGGAISLVMFLDDVGFRDAVMTPTCARHSPERQSKLVPVARNSADHDRRQRDKASWLWSQRQPITGSIAEALRPAGRITCPLPPTLGFLPQRRPERHPGVITAPRDVAAVHLTLLKPDGSGKAEIKPNKIMISSPGGKPIVIAPPNDLLGLAITEGIEEALTAHQETGLGAWADGSGGFMPKLADAVPDCIDCVSVFADANQAGESNSGLLAERLDARGILVEVLPLAEVRS